VLRETHAMDMVMDGDADVVRSGGRKDLPSELTGLKPIRELGSTGFSTMEIP